MVQKFIQFISKQVSTFPSLLVTPLLVLTLHKGVSKMVLHVLFTEIRSTSAWYNNVQRKEFAGCPAMAFLAALRISVSTDGTQRDPLKEQGAFQCPGRTETHF